MPESSRKSPPSADPISAMSIVPTGDTSAASKTPRKIPLRERSPVLAHLRSVFITGVLTAIPLFITLYVVTVLYQLITRYTQGPAVWIVDHLLAPFQSSPFVAHMESIATATFAILLSLVVVYVLGLLGTFVIGRQILAQIEHFIENLPLIKGIYGTSKQVIAVFRQGGGGAGFQRVVLVQFPREGTWTVAFVTNTVHDSFNKNSIGLAGGITPDSASRLVCCFIPMTPIPTSGFFQMFPEDEVRDTDWSVDLGIKIVLSGGLLAPHDISAPAAAVATVVSPAAPLNVPPEKPAT